MAKEFGQADSDVGPHFVIENTEIVLARLQIAHVPRTVLGSLLEEDMRIINALDALLIRAWR